MPKLLFALDMPHAASEPTAARRLRSTGEESAQAESPSQHPRWAGCGALPVESVSQQPESSSFPPRKGRRGEELVPAGGQRSDRALGKAPPAPPAPRKRLEFTPSGHSKYSPRRLPDHARPPSLTYLRRAGSTSSLEPAVPPSPQARAQPEPLGGESKRLLRLPAHLVASWRRSRPRWRRSQSTPRAPAPRSLFQFEQNLIGRCRHSPAPGEREACGKRGKPGSLPAAA